jgi:geranylgeranyl reductase family protein
MQVCDVLVVGGGPAGSTCARRLVDAGLDVIVVDVAAFPRDKPCAGWVTPAVFEALGLAPEEYERSLNVLQPIRGFRTSVVGEAAIVTRYPSIVSYAIRRCEFDTYLLRRSRARMAPPQAVTAIRRDGSGFVVNDGFRARILIGAGGHFCPVARFLNPGWKGRGVVLAQEVEYAIAASDLDGCRVAEDTPELFFDRDLGGYGWCVRKGRYLNIGAGSRTGRLARLRSALLDALARRGVGTIGVPWKGHAYVPSDDRRDRVAGEGVFLVGDAAGLAVPTSGEGIGPAVASANLAADAILAATREQAPANYERALRRCFGPPSRRNAPTSAVRAWAGRQVLRIPSLTRRWVLERGFLRAARPG